MKRSGTADLPLHGGRVPPWLAERMTALGTAIAECIVLDRGPSEFLTRLSDPFWFQAFGAVMGMDWHSSGITTSVLGALKRGLNPRFADLGLMVCGGRGRHSTRTPAELRSFGVRTGLDGDALARTSRLTARVDNNAVADGFQLYLHSFVLTAAGEWAVVQQGMNPATHTARRYHWHSATVRDFTSAPHTAIVGQPQGQILNLVDLRATPAQQALLTIAQEPIAQTLREAQSLSHPTHTSVILSAASSQREDAQSKDLHNPQHPALPPNPSAPELRAETRHLTMPSHHDVRPHNVDLKRLGAVLAVAHEQDLRDFASLLLLEGLGPRTLQSLALIAEVVHGAPTRFSDPARFAFAHGGKDGHPFPVPLKTYDESLTILRRALTSARLGHTDKLDAFKRLDRLTRQVEDTHSPLADFDATLAHERAISKSLGGRTVFDDKPTHRKRSTAAQQSLF